MSLPHNYFTSFNISFRLCDTDPTWYILMIYWRKSYHKFSDITSDII